MRTSEMTVENEAEAKAEPQANKAKEVISEGERRKQKDSSEGR